MRQDERQQDGICFGCVADDFTGAGDVASFLADEGVSALLVNGIPQEAFAIPKGVQAVVIALKTRTAEKEEAVRESDEAFDWLRNKGCRRLYFKYCSTFDSTPEGNIGPVIDSVLERYQLPYTILCPALPVNQRTVREGVLYVNERPLEESYMRDHPLTPMTKSRVDELIEEQGKYQALTLTGAELDRGRAYAEKKISAFSKENKHFYVSADFYEERHGDEICRLFRELPFLTGSSGLVKVLAKEIRERRGPEGKAEEKAHEKYVRYGGEENSTRLILAGSCSTMTIKQIKRFMEGGGKTVRIYPEDVFNGKQTRESIWQFIEQNRGEDLLLFSSAASEQVRENQKKGIKEVSEKLEQLMAGLALDAVCHGYRKLIVAGGETSGAVIKKLDYTAFMIGESVAPGVPVLIPLENEKLQIVLKSGNFGDEDFFVNTLAKRGAKSNAEHREEPE